MDTVTVLILLEGSGAVGWPDGETGSDGVWIGSEVLVSEEPQGFFSEIFFTSTVVSDATALGQSITTKKSTSEAAPVHCLDTVFQEPAL